MDFLKLTTDKLDLTEICEMVADEKCGAVASFAGTTRDNFEGKHVRFFRNRSLVTVSCFMCFKGHFT